MSARLPVLATVAAAYRDVFGDIVGFLRAAWLMGVLLIVLFEIPMMFLIDYTAKNILPEMRQQVVAQKEAEAKAKEAAPEEKKPADEAAKPEASPETKTPPPSPEVTKRNALLLAATFVLSLLQMIIVFRFTSGWYRQLLLGENKGKFISLRVGRLEIQLLWTAIKVGFAIFPFMLLGIGVISAASTAPDRTAFAFNPWPFAAFFGVLALYAQARLSLAYPTTAMGESEAPVRQSWNLTRRQGFRILFGNLLVVIPVLTGSMLFFYGLSWMIDATIGLPHDFVKIADAGAFALQLFLKSLGDFALLAFIGVLSAFHAHAYAYLVRSSSSVSSS